MQTLQEAISLLYEIAKLMELRGENPFKVRAFENAAQNLSHQQDLTELAKQRKLSQIPGIGKTIEEVLMEFLFFQKSTLRASLLGQWPHTVVELLKVPGLGPKKIRTLLDELHICSIVELEYACKENRLLKINGFGQKTQTQLLEATRFILANQGYQKISDIEKISNLILKKLSECFPLVRIEETGELRRKREIINQLDYLVQSTENIEPDLQKSIVSPLPVLFHFSEKDQFGTRWIQTTGSPDHCKKLTEISNTSTPFSSYSFQTEEEYYQMFNLPWISPELRETGEEITLAQNGLLSHIMPWTGIKGIFHNHTTWSDGNATLEEMVSSAQSAGFHYIGISDHSQSAFYANGLIPEKLQAQKEEVIKVQKKFPMIRIFWGIESDILGDGNLDYEENVLKKFDFVIASIHSRFQMDRQTMTERLIRAVQNPFTRFLGHPTGRLLLGRKGYDVDMDSVIQAASRCNVAIEMNANPSRMDLDWHWGKSLRQHNALIAISPDAHETIGIHDIRYGIISSRKALIQENKIINTQSVSEVEKWLKRI